jgi:hypothetical protein
MNNYRVFKFCNSSLQIFRKDSRVPKGFPVQIYKIERVPDFLLQSSKVVFFGSRKNGVDAAVESVNYESNGGFATARFNVITSSGLSVGHHFTRALARNSQRLAASDVTVTGSKVIENTMCWHDVSVPESADDVVNGIERFLQ